MKCKCGNATYKIETSTDCCNCKHNGAYHDEDGWIYDQGLIDRLGLARNEAEDSGECELGSSWNAGCHIYICTKCGDITNTALMDG